MPLLPPARQFVDNFFKAVQPIEEAYGVGSFGYVARRQDGRWALIQGALIFNPIQTKAPLTHFQSENIRAGHFLLSDVQLNERSFVERALDSEIAIPNGRLHFPPAEGGFHGASYIPFHPIGLQAQNRLNALNIFGGQPQLQDLRQHDFDWELKASPTPFDNLQELMIHYHVGQLRGGVAPIEVLAPTIAAIDGACSSISGDTHHRCSCSKKLSKRKSSHWISRI
jgi:hypothetical protein